MSDAKDPESQTEEATEKKISDTLEKGNAPVSKDAGVIALFLGFLLSMSFVIENSGRRLVGSLGLAIAGGGQFSFRNGADATSYLNAIFLEIARFLAPVCAIFILAGLAASFAQGVPRFVFDRVAPDFSRVSILAGSKRLLGAAAVIEFIKALFKMSIVAGVLAFSLRVDHDVIIDTMRIEPRLIPGEARKLILHLTAVLCIPVAALVIADIIWVRIKWRRDIRMSRQEIKEEFKQAEGDPIIKAKLRSLAMDRSRKRMIASVPKATLVITNPTHYAIALRYVSEEGGAPIVVAKGKNLIAQKIRDIAERHDIPIIEKRALVRSMFDHVDIDRMIPSEFYKPVAQLIHFLNSTHRSS